jgi:hypothetical protein
MKSDKLAQRIASFILRIQEVFARGMEKIFSRLAAGRIKILVLIFSVLTGGLSLYFIVDGLWMPQKNITIKPDAIYVPLQPEAEDDFTWNSIENFKNYMDSLSVHAPRMYNNIIQKRPGLMDSITTLEQIYYSQFK